MEEKNYGFAGINNRIKRDSFTGVWKKNLFGTSKSVRECLSKLCFASNENGGGKHK